MMGQSIMPQQGHMDTEDNSFDLSIGRKASTDGGTAAVESSVDMPQGDNASTELSENIAEDLVEYSRGNTIRNEHQSLLIFNSWISGWAADEDDFVNLIVRGVSSDGKSQTVDTMLELLYKKNYYNVTTGSDKSFIDDPKWNKEDTRAAPLDELNKLSEDIHEFMKSVAGDDGGYRYNRSKGGSESKENHEGGEAGVDEIFKKPLPFTVLYADGQGTVPTELDTRLFKCHIESSRKINKAVARMNADHSNISVTENGVEYIYSTAELKSELKDHVDGMPYNTHTRMPEWVHWAVEPIFHFGHPSSKRVSGMVYNMIRNWARINYKNREVVTKDIDGETVDAYLVEPQDVANVLSAYEVLLGTTHNLSPTKQVVIQSLKEQSSFGEESYCFIDDVRNYIERELDDESLPSKKTLRNTLEDLANQFIITIHERVDNSHHGYEFNGLGNIETPRITGLTEFEYDTEQPFRGVADPDDPFKNCMDPVAGIPFKESVKQWREMFADGTDITAADAMGTSESNSGPTDGQSKLLTSKEDNEPYRPEGVSAYVYDRLLNHTDGVRFDDPTDVETIELLGYVDDDESVVEVSVDGTMCDPEHEMWGEGLPTPASKGAARTEIDNAVKELRKEEIVEVEELGSGEYTIAVSDIEYESER